VHNGLKFKHYPERDISKGYLSAARSQGDLILIEDPFVSRFNAPLDNRRDFFHRYTVQSSEIRHLTVWVRRLVLLVRLLFRAANYCLLRGASERVSSARGPKSKVCEPLVAARKPIGAERH